MPEHPPQLLGVYFILLKWRKFLFSLLAAVALLSALVAWLLPNEYKSTTVFYPTNLNAVNPDEIVGGNRSNTEVFGNTEDIDRILTIAYSQPLAEYIIQKYNLAQHYGLDTLNETNRQNVLEEFLDNFTAEHTERDAVAIAFFDQDRNLAATVANDIAARIDELNQQLTYENRRKVLAIFANRYQYLEQQYQLMRDSLLESRRRYRIFGTERETPESRPESRYLAKQLIQTETELRQVQAEVKYWQKAGGASAKLQELKSRVQGLESAFAALSSAQNGNLINYETYVAGNEIVSSLEAQTNDLQQQVIESKKSYLNARLALENNVSSIYVVQKAYPATKKSRPVRWLIVVGAVLFSFLLAVTAIVLLETSRQANYPGRA